MNAYRTALLSLAVSMAIGATAQAADCTTIDFESMDTGTPVFGQYEISDLLSIYGDESMEVLEEALANGSILAYNSNVNGQNGAGGENWLPGDNAKSFGNASTVRGATSQNLTIEFDPEKAVYFFAIDISDYGDWFPIGGTNPRTVTLKAYDSDDVLLFEDGLSLTGPSSNHDVFSAGLRNLATPVNDPIIAYVKLEFDDLDPGVSFDNIEVCHDEDNDGVLGDDDLCPNTEPDDPILRLGTNRWIWNGVVWDTNAQGVDKNFTIEETQGCSCEQILDELVDKTDLEFDGHYKFGCSQSVVEDWISGLYYMETVEVPAYSETVTVGVPAESITILKASENYQLMAHGTADALNQDGRHIPFDAKYSVSTETGEDVNNPADWTDLVTGYEGYGSELLDLFVNGANIDWGPFDPAHVYWYGMPGTDSTASFLIYDIYYTNNVGFLYVDIFVELW